MIKTEIFRGHWEAKDFETNLIPPIDELMIFLETLSEEQYIDVKEISSGYLLIYKDAK